MLPANQNFKKFDPTTQQFLYSYIQSKSEDSATTVAKVRLSDFYGHQARQKSPPSPSPPPTLRSALERGTLAIRAQKGFKN